MTGVATVGLVLAAAWRMRRTNAIASFGLLWFLVLLVPSAALVVVGEGEGMVEHRVYLASIGIFVAVAVGAARLLARIDSSATAAKWLVMAVGVMGLLSLSARTVLRNAVWSNSVMLWSEAVSLAPGSWLPHTVLGEALHADGHHREAIGQFRTAIALRPQEELGYLKVALCLAEIGRTSEARTSLETLRGINPESATVPLGLGIVALTAGDAVEAKSDFLESLKLHPRDPMALQWIALIDEQIDNDPTAALEVCKQIQAILPGDLGNEQCIQRNLARMKEMKVIKEN